MQIHKKIHRLMLIGRSAVVTRGVIRDLLKKKDAVKIHLGCGPRLFAGWINTDYSIDRDRKIIYVNLLRKLPFPDDFATFVFSEAAYEHFSYEEGGRLLREIHRIIRPAGVLRLAVPDLDFFMRLYADQKKYSAFIQKYCRLMNPEGPPGANAIINSVFMGHGHRYMYDFQELKDQLEAAGFRNVRKMEPGQSDYEELKYLETDPLARGETLDLHVAYTLCVEGEK
jgi:predicted SAM-dependent methyltransferase